MYGVSFLKGRRMKKQKLLLAWGLLSVAALQAAVSSTTQLNRIIRLVKSLPKEITDAASPATSTEDVATPVTELATTQALETTIVPTGTPATSTATQPINKIIRLVKSLSKTSTTVATSATSLTPAQTAQIAQLVATLKSQTAALTPYSNQNNIVSQWTVEDYVNPMGTTAAQIKALGLTKAQVKGTGLNEAISAANKAIRAASKANVSAGYSPNNLIISLVSAAPAAKTPVTTVTSPVTSPATSPVTTPAITIPGSASTITIPAGQSIASMTVYLGENDQVVETHPLSAGHIQSINNQLGSLNIAQGKYLSASLQVFPDVAFFVDLVQPNAASGVVVQSPINPVEATVYYIGYTLSGNPSQELFSDDANIWSGGVSGGGQTISIVTATPAATLATPVAPVTTTSQSPTPPVTSPATTSAPAVTPTPAASPATTSTAAKLASLNQLITDLQTATTNANNTSITSQYTAEDMTQPINVANAQIAALGLTSAQIPAATAQALASAQSAAATAVSDMNTSQSTWNSSVGQEAAIDEDDEMGM